MKYRDLLELIATELEKINVDEVMREQVKKEDITCRTDFATLKSNLQRELFSQKNEWELAGWFETTFKRDIDTLIGRCNIERGRIFSDIKPNGLGVRLSVIWSVIKKENLPHLEKPQPPAAAGATSSTALSQIEARLANLEKESAEKSRQIAVYQPRAELAEQITQLIPAVMGELGLTQEKALTLGNLMQLLQLAKVDASECFKPEAPEFRSIPSEFAIESKVLTSQLKAENPREYARQTWYAVSTDLRFVAVEMLIKYLDELTLAIYFYQQNGGKQIFNEDTVADIYGKLPKDSSEILKLKSRLETYMEDVKNADINELTRFIGLVIFYVACEIDKSWDQMFKDPLNPVKAWLEKYPTGMRLASVNATLAALPAAIVTTTNSTGPGHVPQYSQLTSTLFKIAGLHKKHSDDWGRALATANLSSRKDGTDTQKIRRVVGKHLQMLFAENGSRHYFPANKIFMDHAGKLYQGTDVNADPIYKTLKP